MATRILTIVDGENQGTISRPIYPPIEIFPNSKISLLNFSANYKTTFKIQTGKNDTITFYYLNNVQTEIDLLTATIPAGDYTGELLAKTLQRQMNLQLKWTLPLGSLVANPITSCEQGAEVIVQYIDGKFKFYLYAMPTTFPYLAPTSQQVIELSPDTFTTTQNGTIPTASTTFLKNQYLGIKDVPASPDTFRTLIVDSTAGTYTVKNFPFVAGGTTRISGVNLEASPITATISSIALVSGFIVLTYPIDTFDYADNAQPITDIVINLDDNWTGGGQKINYLQLQNLSLGPAQISFNIGDDSESGKLIRIEGEQTGSGIFFGYKANGQPYFLSKSFSGANLAVPNNIAVATGDIITIRKEQGKIYYWVYASDGTTAKIVPNLITGDNIITIGQTYHLDTRLILKLAIRVGTDSISSFTTTPSISELSSSITNTTTYLQPQVSILDEGLGFTNTSGATCYVDFQNDKTRLTYGMNSLTYSNDNITGMSPSEYLNFNSSFVPTSIFQKTPLIIIRLLNIKLSSYDKDKKSNILTSFSKDINNSQLYISKDIDVPQYLRLDYKTKDYIADLQFRIENDNGEVLEVENVSLTVLIDFAIS